MSSHLDEDQLLDLALAETDPVGDAAAHLASCPKCTSTYDDLRLGSQLLRAAKGTPSGAVAPPPRVWEAVQASLDETDATDATLEQGSGARRPAYLTPWFYGLAAVLVLVGLVSGLLINQGTRAPSETVVAQAALEPLAEDAESSSARIVESGAGLALVVEAPRFQVPSDYLEVWLINEDLERMVSVGVLDTDGSQQFPITQRMLDEGYRIVDISREQFDDDSTHSGDSLVRGELAT